jgi:ribonuclease P protein component
MRHRFPREARLTRREDFERVYRRGGRIVVRPLHVRFLRRDEKRGGKRSRLGLSIGKTVGPAHVRNRWKRAIREAFRLNRHCLPAAYDLVIGVDWDSTEEELLEVADAFVALGTRLNAEQGGGDD